MDQVKQRRYRAAISNVSPKNISKDLSGIETGMLGLSLGTKNSEGERLIASINFMTKHFAKSAVIIGDGLYHLTLQVTQGLSEAEAKKQALIEGKKLYQRNQETLEEFKEQGNTEVIFLSAIRKHPNFETYLWHMRALFQRSERFQFEVDEFVSSYMARIYKDVEMACAEEARTNYALAVEYILQECALFSCLKDMGWACFVYGGSLSTFEKLAAGEIEGALYQLQHLPFVSVRFEKKGWRYLTVEDNSTVVATL